MLRADLKLTIDIKITNIYIVRSSKNSYILNYYVFTNIKNF